MERLLGFLVAIEERHFVLCRKREQWCSTGYTTIIEVRHLRVDLVSSVRRRVAAVAEALPDGRERDLERGAAGERVDVVLGASLERLRDAPVPLALVVAPGVVFGADVSVFFERVVSQEVRHELPALLILCVDGLRLRVLVVRAERERPVDGFLFQSEDELVARQHGFAVPIVDEIDVLAVDGHRNDKIDRRDNRLPTVVLVLPALLFGAGADAVRHKVLLHEHAHGVEQKQLIETVCAFLQCVPVDSVVQLGVVKQQVAPDILPLACC